MSNSNTTRSPSPLWDTWSGYSSGSGSGKWQQRTRTQQRMEQHIIAKTSIRNICIQHCTSQRRPTSCSYASSNSIGSPSTHCRVSPAIVMLQPSGTVHPNKTRNCESDCASSQHCPATPRTNQRQMAPETNIARGSVRRNVWPTSRTSACAHTHTHTNTNTNPQASPSW